MADESCAVIVGAGHGGSELAVSLREQGWAGRIVLIGDEASLPYHRPPLSKAYLTGEASEPSLQLRPEAAYDKAQVERWAGVRVAAIDRERRAVRLADGRELEYTKLALATGGRARSLPGSVLAAPCANVHMLRNLADAQGIRAQLSPGARLVVIGAGYVGLETAASAVKLGLQVTVLESAPRVLSRVTAPEISAFYEQAHREAGVDLRTGVQLERLDIDADGQRVGAVHCVDGAVVPCDLVIAGVGQQPNVELAEAAGLVVDNGIVVDEHTRTCDPDVVAIGDCSNHPSLLYERRMRLESVPNALEQARTAAAALCGKDRPYNAVPWFWSDQYDLKLKMVGLSQGYERLVLRGSLAGRAFSAFYLAGRRVLAVDTVSRPQEFMLARRLVGERIEVDAAQLGDESVPLKSLLPAA
jgi:3-phenylpropionate/trans-cinnamate dioxygenase ferredoxin reductase subunit